MTRRSITALAVASIMGLAACGGGGSGTLSEDDFVDEVNGICRSANRDLDRIDDPQSIDDIENFAKDSADVFTTLQEDLADIKPPEDLANDFADVQDTIDEVISLLGDLEEAGNDGDEDKVNSIADDLAGLSDDLTGLAEDLGVDDCIFADEQTGDTTPDEPASTVPETTIPPTTAAPITLPATIPPTAPPATAPPATVPPETVPDTGALFSVVDLTTVFNDPFGFTMVDTGQDAALPFIEAVAAVPILNIGIDEMGVAALIDSFGDSIGTLVVGVSLEGLGMPEEWKTQICAPNNSEIRTTPAGYVGVYCPTPGGGILEAFTITEGDIGVTIALIDPFYAVEDVVDAFLLANF
jgi:hypothetical protein